MTALYIVLALLPTILTAGAIIEHFDLLRHIEPTEQAELR